MRGFSYTSRAKPFVLGAVMTLFSFFASTSSVLAEELSIVGTGDSQTLLRALADDYERTHPGNHITIPDSIGSSGGIRAVASGKYALARIARPLSPQEESYGLTTHVFGYSAVTFIVNNSITWIDNLTSNQVVSIFSGDISNWSELGGPDQNIYLVNREAGDSSQQVLSREIPLFAEIDTFPGPTFFNTPEAMGAVSQHAYTIGYGPVSMAKSATVHPLNYNGIAPTAENVAKGIYPLSLPLSLAWKGDLPLAYRPFVDFLSSTQARKTMLKYGIQPVDR